ncbi:MAG: 3-methyl-2-oxobutanoate hydroxymethyltransferase [Elusimicrobiota bacterium]
MEKQSIRSLKEKKRNKIPLVALTCYDAFSAQLIDQLGVDIALVGDSLANTRLGYPNTIPVTIEEMLHHVKASSRGIKNALLVADMPFMSYEMAPWEAAKTAGKFIKSGGAQAVKVEGGKRIGPSIKAILEANIPVMGHLGLTPQSINIDGGYRVHGKTTAEAKLIEKDALYLQSLGVFSIVLEGIPELLAKKITKLLKIPTIGIGAGIHCDGQILVLDDVLGFNNTPVPKFVKKYAQIRPLMEKALERFKNDVLNRQFPGKENSYH